MGLWKKRWGQGRDGQLSPLRVMTANLRTYTYLVAPAVLSRGGIVKLPPKAASGTWGVRRRRQGEGRREHMQRCFLVWQIRLSP